MVVDKAVKIDWLAVATSRQTARFDDSEGKMSALDHETFLVERYVPPACPACLREFRKTGEDYINYPGLRSDPDGAQRVRSHLQLLEGAFFPATTELPERRFGAELVQCACRNVTVAIKTGERMVRSHTDAERLCHEAGYTSIHPVRTNTAGYRAAREYQEQLWGAIEIPGL